MCWKKPSPTLVRVRGAVRFMAVRVFDACNLMREKGLSTVSAWFGLFSFGALFTSSTGIRRIRSRTRARNSSTHSMGNYRNRSCNRTTDKRMMDSHTNSVRNSCSQCMYMTFLFSTSPSYTRTSDFDQSLPSQSLTASSTAPLRFPFLPPSLITIANRSRRSTSSESTM